MDSILAASRYSPSASVTRPVRLQVKDRVGAGWIAGDVGKRSSNGVLK